MLGLSRGFAQSMGLAVLLSIGISAPAPAQGVFDVILQEAMRQQAIQAQQEAIRRQQAAERAAEERRVAGVRQTWNALDENVRACVNQYLQLGGQNVDVLVQQGIPATDPRLGAYLSECNVVSSVRLLKGKPCVVESAQTLCNEVFVYTSAPTSPLGPEQLAAAVVAKRLAEIGTTDIEAPAARARRVAAAEQRRRDQMIDSMLAKLAPLSDPNNAFSSRRAAALQKQVKTAQTNPKATMEQISGLVADVDRLAAEDREEKMRVERVRAEKIARGEVDVKGAATGANQKIARTNAYWEIFLKQLRDVSGAQADGALGKDFRALADKNFDKFRADFFTGDTSDKCTQASNAFRCDVVGTFKVAALKAEASKVMSAAISSQQRNYRFILRYPDPEDHQTDCGEQKAETTRFLVSQVSAEFSRRGYTIIAKSAEDAAEQKGEFDYYINLLDINHCDALDFNGNFLSVTLRAQMKLLDKGADPSKRLELANVPVSNTKRVIRNQQTPLAAVKRESLPLQGGELAGLIVREIDAKLLTMAQNQTRPASAVAGAVRSMSQYSIKIDGVGQRDRQQIRALRDLVKAKLGAETTVEPKGTTDKSIEITFDHKEKFDPEDIVDALYDLFKERKTFRAKYNGDRTFTGQI